MIVQQGLDPQHQPGADEAPEGGLRRVTNCGGLLADSSTRSDTLLRDFHTID